MHLYFIIVGCLNTCIISATVNKLELKETFLPDFPAEKPISIQSQTLYSCSFKVAMFAYIDLHRPDSSRHVSFQRAFTSISILFDLFIILF